NLFYQPVTNYVGMDAFSFVVNDGNGDSAPATVTISLSMGNRPPLAIGALLETLEDIPIRITLSASDANNDALRYEIVQQTTNGVLSGSSNLFEYLPGTNFFGEDSFTFRVRDGQFTSEPAVISLIVVATNDAPAATNVVFEITEDGTIGFSLNAFDAETNDLTFTTLALPVYGVLSGDAPNYIYTPYPNFYGADELEYVVSDGLATSVVASVTFIVHPTNDTPLASSNSLDGWEDQFLPITLHAIDIDADPLTFEIIEEPKHGTLVGSPPNLYYLPNTNYFGDDSLIFVATDGQSVSEPAIVQIKIIGVDDWPIIFPLEDQIIRKNATLGPLSFTVTDADNPLNDLLIWFTSANEDLVSWQNITVLPGNEEFVLTPRTNATGETTITMNVNDGYALVKSSFKLTITNSPPLADDDFFEREAGTVSIDLTALLYNDTDADGDHLTVASVSSSEQGRSVQLTTNAVIYLGSSEPGEDLFSYEIEDTSGARSSATVRLILTNKPKIQNISRVGQDVRVDLSGPPNREFWLLSSVDGTEWDQVQAGLTDTVGHAQIIHNGGGTGQHHRFYRVVWP
ncbi:MAG TPA: Ig-like domain-containing protein, partial [Verrucomicrobiae bacterium]